MANGDLLDAEGAEGPKEPAQLEGKAANNQLQQTEEWLRMLIDSAEDYAIFSIGSGGKIATWNRGAERVFGYRPEEVIGKEFAILFTPEDRQQGAPEEEIRRAQEGGYSPDERWHLRSDGSRIWVSGAVRPLRDPDGQVHGFLKVAHDITEQRRKEEALRESEERLRLMWENVKDFAIFTFDWDGRITHWNPGAESMFGYPAEQVLGQDVAMLYSIEDRAAGLPSKEREVALREGLQLSEHWCIAKDGRKIFVTEAVRRMEDSNGRVRGFTMAARDITQRKKLEDELRDARDHLERLVSERTAQLQSTVSQLEAFSYSLSHDLRAPLRAMRGYSEVLSARFGQQLDPEARRLVSEIMAGAKRLDQLIQDVLAFGRIGREDIGLGAVDLEPLLRRIVNQDARLQSPEAEVSIVTPMPKVLGSEALLQQVFSNLLDNAIKFVPAGVRPTVRVYSETHGNVVRVWLEDNGIGIPKELQHRIFGLFQRLHSQDEYPGTGLGLAIVRKAIERMGGQAGVESEPGRGSRFWLELVPAPG